MASTPQDFGTARMLGIAGSALVLLGILVPLASIVGFILVLVSLYMLSKMLGEESIFRNAVISVALSIAGFLAFIFITGASLFTLATGRAFEPGEIEALSAAGIGGLILGFIVFYVLLVASAVFFRRALDTLAEKSGVDMFRYAGLAYLIGSITLIIIIGGLVLLVSWVLLLVGFIQLKAQEGGVESPTAPMQSPGVATGRI
ncbi:DUF996 domain-containing protein [Aeropyrum camini]|uniref:Predicted membrane protein n=1 Tax=Aeropyrum camini SY1 = JCM 12091 TaxID=1198449 RepID=U3TEP7_9CREN|nr:DUF996 domain-containing protein [Aeropyrum camini]BAN90438.1 predicted membrane protein [Aeropyrum camini SY1 = JCM 12091]